MVCYHPLKGYRSRSKSVNGKYYWVSSPSDGVIDLPMSVPCGNCIGCRLERSKQWAIRCVHEASLHEKNCFITLTFDDSNLAKDGSLHVRDFQLFMKRFRKKFPGEKIRFFHCGEYGSKFSRPHHHACIFGFDFPDKELWSVRDGVKLYRSFILDSLWGQGYCTVGDVTFESAAYVARYITKKVNGSKSYHHYATGIDYSTGELIMRKPEYITMSRRPGIAHDWLIKYSSDVYPDDSVLIRHGVKVKPPKYYDSIYDSIGDLDKVKVQRKIKASQRKEDNTTDRLLVREEYQKLRFKQLKRSFEND